MAAPCSGCAICFLSARGAGTGSGHPRASPRHGAGRWPSSSAPQGSLPRQPHAGGWGAAVGQRCCCCGGKLRHCPACAPSPTVGCVLTVAAGKERHRGAVGAVRIPAPHPGVAGLDPPHCGMASLAVGHQGLHGVGHGVGLAPHGTWLTVCASEGPEHPRPRWGALSPSKLPPHPRWVRLRVPPSVAPTWGWPRSPQPRGSFPPLAGPRHRPRPPARNVPGGAQPHALHPPGLASSSAAI